MTPLPVIPVTIEEIIGCTTKAAKGANKAARNSPSCSFILCFTASVSHFSKTMQVIYIKRNSKVCYYLLPNLLNQEPINPHD